MKNVEKYGHDQNNWAADEHRSGRILVRLHDGINSYPNLDHSEVLQQPTNYD